jgi:hypothetical protein
MQHLEFSGAVQYTYISLGGKGLNKIYNRAYFSFVTNFLFKNIRFENDGGEERRVQGFGGET